MGKIRWQNSCRMTNSMYSRGRPIRWVESIMRVSAVPPVLSVPADLREILQEPKQRLQERKESGGQEW